MAAVDRGRNINGDNKTRRNKKIRLWSIKMTSKLTYKPKGSPHDIVRYIRAHYTSQGQRDPIPIRPKNVSVSATNVKKEDQPPDYDPGPSVEARTSQIYLTKVTNDEKSWEEKHARQKTTLRQGYFTSCTEPFRPVGGRILDLHDLIFNSVGSSLTEKAKLELTKESEQFKDGSKTDDKTRRQSSKPVDWESSEDAILSDAVRSHIRNAGFDEIRGALAAIKRRLTAVKCSTGFATTVKREQEAKNAAREKQEMAESRGMVLSRLSSDFLCAIDVEQIPSPDGRQVTAAVNKDETQFDIQFTEMDDDFKSQPRRVRNFLQKLKCIYIVLTSVNNLRNKYLKNKVPLKWNFVKQLRLDTPPGGRDKDTRASQAWALTLPSQFSQQVKMSTSTLLSTADSRAYPENSDGGSPSKHQLHASTMRARGSVIDKDMFLPGRRGKYQKRMTIKDEFRLDTWEDLMAVNPADRDPKKVKAQKKIPPWQQSWSHDRPKSKMDKQSEKERTEMLEIIEDNPWDKFERQKDYLMDVKSTFRRQVEKRLVKLERERLYKGRKRLSSLNRIYPLWSQQLSHLREATCPQNVLTQNAESSMVVELAHWFIQLQNESVNLHIDEDEETERRLGKLEKFAREELESVPLIREKLCLLVSSLPAHEICTPQMQNSIKFVLGEVLLADDPTDMLRRWLQYRNLYVLSP